MNARRKKRAAAALALALLMTMLSGCAGSAAVPKPSEAPVAVEPAGPAEPAEAAETQPAAPERQDGERFEDIIILEGMEETVQYEHVRSDGLGFEMDYDYENFVRRSEGDRECFVSNYDDPENPEYYLEVTCNPQDAETVAAAIGGSDLEVEDNKVAKANIDIKFADSKVASCDNLIAIFTPRFEADPENMAEPDTES